MNRISEFCEASCLLLVLFFYSLVKTDYPAILCLCMAALLIMFTIRSLEKEHSRLLAGVLILLCLLFSYFSDTFFASLICLELRIDKPKVLRIALPSMVTGVITALSWQGEARFAEALFQMLLLLAVSAIIITAERLYTDVIVAQEGRKNALYSSAISELQERKLNKELTLRNYLVDRNARLEERESISRNIHNSVGHSITAAVMTLDAAELLIDVDSEKAKAQVATARERMKGGLESIRSAVRVLDHENELLTMSEFIRRLEKVSQSFGEEAAVETQLDVSYADREVFLPWVHADFLVGALQELFSNGLRHGGANRFWVKLLSDSAHVELIVLDNGVSDFDIGNSEQRLQQGFGLKKLDAYLKRCGGSTVYRNENGFYAKLTLPLVENIE